MPIVVLIPAIVMVSALVSTCPVLVLASAWSYVVMQLITLASRRVLLVSLVLWTVLVAVAPIATVFGMPSRAFALLSTVCTVVLLIQTAKLPVMKPMDTARYVLLVRLPALIAQKLLAPLEPRNRIRLAVSRCMAVWAVELELFSENSARGRLAVDVWNWTAMPDLCPLVIVSIILLFRLMHRVLERNPFMDPVVVGVGLSLLEFPSLPLLVLIAMAGPLSATLESSYWVSGLLPVTTPSVFSANPIYLTRLPLLGRTLPLVFTHALDLWPLLLSLSYRPPKLINSMPPLSVS